MSLDAIVIEQSALSILDSAIIEEDWFSEFGVPPQSTELKRIVHNNIAYIFTVDADEKSGLLVVNAKDDGVFSSSINPTQIFERIVRVALRQFDRGISIPVQWSPFNDGSLFSIFATNLSKKSNIRVYFNRSPDESNNIYAYTITDGPKVLTEAPANVEVYKKAVDGYIDAILTEEPSPKNIAAGNYGLVLSKPLGSFLARPGSISEWIERILTSEQLAFVNSDTKSPIRLRGAAGTGKTQAMVIKCLKELYHDADVGGDKTFLFLTHSSALAQEVVRGMLYALDSSGRWNELLTSDGEKKLMIGTLYELAQAKLDYQKKGLRPISIDGAEGRELQRDIIKEIILAIKNDAYINIELLDSCEMLRVRIHDDRYHAGLIDEIVNEFACTLDAENIRKGSKEAEQYIASQRDRWQMQLYTPSERRVVLEIYEMYRIKLKEEKFFSLDQMIADFCRYLNTYEWDQLRDRDGFDQIYVDEYHFFTKIEAMTFQPLFKPRSATEGRWPIIMAYDLKQSTTDAPLSGGVSRFVNPGVGASVAMELNQVFRYTPQITSFLSDIDGAFPAMDLEGEFINYSATSSLEQGPIPKLLIFRNDIELIDTVFESAQRLAASNSEGGQQVAVLCLNTELYERYLEVGRIKKYHTPIKSREDLKELRYAKKKCVFSMPEYVSGLQFEHVFLIHADEADLTSEYLSEGAKRRYISRIYVGASRTKKNLTIASSTERGGVSSVLATPLRNGTLAE
ncbi:UvrD-helicase domain-containing protein [Pseudomonas chlororaphis subsp. piscium]